MRSDEEFGAFFAREMIPALRAFETRRAAIRAEIRPRQIAVVAAIALVACVPLKSLAPLAVPGLIALLRVARAQSKLRIGAKQEIVRRVVEFACPGADYRPSGCVPIDVFRRSRLFDDESWNLYGGEDFVTGSLGATRFQFSELRVSAKRGRKEEPRAVFRGLYFVADFNRSFRGETILLPDRAERLFGALGRAFQGLGRVGRGAALVELEDPELERLFSVYATDAVEARYVLSPNLMERIVRFRRNAGAALRISFVDESVHIAFPLEMDLFEVGLGEAPVDEEKVRGWLGQLGLALGIVEDLDLNTRIWSKDPAAAPAPAAMLPGRRA